MENTSVVATENTRLVAVPIQSDQIRLLGIQSEPFFPIPVGTELEVNYIGIVEGANIVGDCIDSDDYFIIHLSKVIEGTTRKLWFAYGPHWKETHAPVEEEKSKKETVVPLNIVAEMSQRLSQPDHGIRDEEIRAVLGYGITLPGYTRDVYLREPVCFVDDKPAPFNWGEVTKGGARIPTKISVVKQVKAIAKKLTPIRYHFDQPIIVTSWYRDPFTNRKVGGSSRSRHMAGDAVDWYPKNDGVTEDSWKELCEIYPEGGLAAGNGFFHTDLWRTRTWQYRGAPAFTRKHHK